MLLRYWCILWMHESCVNYYFFHARLWNQWNLVVYFELCNLFNTIIWFNCAIYHISKCLLQEIWAHQEIDAREIKIWEGRVMDVLIKYNNSNNNNKGTNNSIYSSHNISSFVATNWISGQSQSLTLHCLKQMMQTGKCMNARCTWHWI